jgi:hypothetical protein
MPEAATEVEATETSRETLELDRQLERAQSARKTDADGRRFRKEILPDDGGGRRAAPWRSGERVGRRANADAQLATMFA